MEEQTLKEIARSCEASDPNLAIILYAYLGSKKAGLDGLYAKHCQDFAKSGLKIINDMRLERN